MKLSNILYIAMWLLTTSSQVDNYINSIYYLGQGVSNVYDFSSFDLNRVSHILYAFAGIEGNRATLNFTQTTQADKKVLTGHLGALVAIKQKHRHVKTGISILGDFGSMVPTSEGRATFVTSVIEIMQEYGFDFVDLDWEFPVRGFEKLHVRGNVKDPQYMVELLKEFHQQFKEKLSYRAFITIAIPVPDYYLSVYNFAAIDPYIEFYNTMTYDFSGPFVDFAYHASNLYGEPGVLSVDSSVKRMLSAGLPANKMVVGLPAYAVVFRGCTEKKLFTSYDKELTLLVGDNGYAAVSDLRWDKIEINWDDEAKTSWGWFAGQDMLISYESTNASSIKVDYIKDHGLRGVMVWSLAQDFPIKDSRSLVAATTNRLGMDQLESSDNNINYSNSSFENVKNPKFVVSKASILNISIYSVGLSLFLVVLI